MWVNRRLAKNALYAMGEMYTRIIKINYGTGKWVFIKNTDMNIDDSPKKGGWDEFRQWLLANVHPEYYEMYKNFTSLDNMRMIAMHYPEGDMCTFRRVVGEEDKWIRALIIPMRGKKNKDCVLFCAKDVEESVKAEEYRKSMMLDNLRKAKEAEATKADFLKYLAYDLNTPLNAVIEMCDLAEKYIKQGDVWAAEYYMARVSKMASYTYGVINDVMRRGVLQEEYMQVTHENFSIKNLLVSCKEYATAMDVKDVEFKKETDAALSEWYVGDELRIKQVLFCLLSNAYKFNRVGGSVKLRVYVEEPGEKQDKVVFVVEDTGRGIGGEFLPDMFELFAKEPQAGNTYSKGVGFGLAYAKSVADALGATIRVETTPGKGSKFTTSLWMEKGKPEI